MIPEGVDVINESAFKNSINILSLTLPSTLTDIRNTAFSGCEKLVEVINKSSLNVVRSSQAFGSVGQYANIIHDGESLLSFENGYYALGSILLDYVGDGTVLTLPETVAGQRISRVYKYAFADRDRITEVIFPNGVTSVLEWGTFEGCAALLKVELPAGLTEVKGNAFAYCSVLEEVDIPGNVHTISSYAFTSCPALKAVYIPLSVSTVQENIFRSSPYAVAYCAAPEKPDGWEDGWNNTNEVVWGYGYEEPEVPDTPVGPPAPVIVPTVDPSDIINNTVNTAVGNNAFGGLYVSEGLTAGPQTGFTNSYVVENPVDKSTVWALIANGVTSSTNSYAEIRMLKQLKYTPGVSQYLVYDFDFAPLSDEAHFNFKAVTRSSDRKTAYWPAGFDPKGLFDEMGIGNFAHFTIIIDVNTADLYLFVNNEFYEIVEFGFISEEGHNLFLAGEAMCHDGLRLIQNATMSAAIDNICVRYFIDNLELESCVSNMDMFSWSDGIYGDSYALPTLTPITVTSGSAEKTYDGTSLTSNEYSYEGYLPEGATVQAVVAGSQTNPGSCANFIEDVAIYDAIGNDITHFFKVIPVEGVLTVKDSGSQDPDPEEKLKITIQTASASWIYDGRSHIAREVSTSGDPLPEGAEIVMTSSSTIKEPGIIENRVGFRIVDSEETDITDSFIVSVIYGTLSVERAKITLTAGSAEKIYDGTPLTNDTFTIDGFLAAGHNVTAVINGQQTAVGTSSNSIVSTAICDENGVDVTDCYSIMIVSGTLTVTEEETVPDYTVSVIGYATPTKNKTDIYNVIADATTEGNLFAAPEHLIPAKLTDDIMYTEGSSNITAAFAVDNGMGDDYLELVTFPNATVNTNTILDINRTATVVSPDNIIEYVPGAHQYFVYDIDIARTGESANIALTEINRGESGSIFGVGSFTLKNLLEGTDIYKFIHLTMVCEVNTGDIYLFVNGSLFGHREYGFMGNVTNYEKFISGEVVRHVGLRVDVRRDCAVAIDNVCARHYADSSELAEAMAAEDLSLWSGNLYTEEYDMPIHAAMVTHPDIPEVDEGVIVITTPSVTWKYDGKPHNASSVSVAAGSLPEGATIEILGGPSITAPGDVINEVDFRIIDSEGLDITDTLDITVSYGHLIVNRLNITVIANSAEKVFDGVPLADNGYTLNGSIPDGHSIDVTVTGNQASVGSSVNRVSAVRVYDEMGNDVTTCFNVIIKNGTLTVTEAEEEVEITASVVGNGKPTVDRAEIYNATVNANAENNLCAAVNYIQLARLTANTTYTQGQNESAVSFVVTEGDGENQYLEVVPFVTPDNLISAYIDISRTTSLTSPEALVSYSEQTRQYFIYDFDIARTSDSANLSLVSLSREEATKRLIGVGFNIGTALAEMEMGEFIHVSVVFDVNANAMYIYVNNTLFAKRDSAFVNASKRDAFFAGEAVIHTGIRLNFTMNTPLALDNFSARYVTNDDSLANAIESGEISVWDENLYTNDYELPVHAMHSETASDTEDPSDMDVN